MAEKLFAGVALFVCALLLLRLALSAPRRARVDASLRLAILRLRVAARHAWHWRSERREAERLAQEAIRRARGDSPVERDGNVIRPKSFRRDGGKSRKLH